MGFTTAFQIQAAHFLIIGILLQYEKYLHNFPAVENRKIKTINEKMHQFTTEVHVHLLALFIFLHILGRHEEERILSLAYTESNWLALAEELALCYCVYSTSFSWSPDSFGKNANSDSDPANI